MSEVRGSGREYQTGMVQELPRGATPRLRSAGAAGRSNPLPRPGAMSQEDQPHIQGAVAVRPQEGLE